MTNLQEISELEQTIEEHKAALAKAEKRLQEYRGRVKSGTITLGNSLDDFVFVWHGDSRKKWHDIYNALAQLCTEDTPIMVEYEGTYPSLKSHTFGGESTYENLPYTTKNIGILTSSIAYNIQQGYVIFPVEFYFQKHIKIFKINLQRCDQSLQVSASDFQNYGNYIPFVRVEGSLLAMPHDKSMRIILGSKEEYRKRKSSRTSEEYDNLFEQKRLVGSYSQERKELILITE